MIANILNIRRSAANSTTGSVAATAFVMMFAVQGYGQWAKTTDASIPRTKDGQPNLSAPAPRTSDGKTDLSGLWLVDPDPKGIPQGVENAVFPRYFINIAADLKPEEVPFRPAAEALLKKRLASQGKELPSSFCKPTGVPMLNSVPVPFKIIQTPRLIVILYEENNVFRQIFLDARRPIKDAEPRFMGYSTGKWDGGMLVVETVGFNDQTWLDGMGHPHSDALRVIERFRRRDAGHLDIETTIDDPKMYTKPMTYTVTTTLVPDEDLLEYFCSDNEKDVQHFK
jgi:hypothetical protein